MSWQHDGPLWNHLEGVGPRAGDESQKWSEGHAISRTAVSRCDILGPLLGTGDAAVTMQCARPRGAPVSPDRALS